MKTYLIDENLPAGINDVLDGPARLVSELGRQLSDGELWNRARQEDWIIVTRDADFFDRLVAQGPPPKVVWVRLGNMRRRELIGNLRDRWSRISGLLVRADLVEVQAERLEGLSFT